MSDLQDWADSLEPEPYINYLLGELRNLAPEIMKEKDIRKNHLLAIALRGCLQAVEVIKEGGPHEVPSPEPRPRRPVTRNPGGRP